MKIVRNGISDTDIKIIKDNYKLGKSDSYMKRNHSYDIDKLIDYDTIFYCDTQNKFILDVISKLISSDETIYSIHYITYVKGDSCIKHLDRASNGTYIFMLNDDFEGGRLLVNDVDTNLSKGDFVRFNGSIDYHEVTKVIKGIREVLVVWTSELRNSHVI